jgi:hypothetical protein
MRIYGKKQVLHYVRGGIGLDIPTVLVLQPHESLGRFCDRVRCSVFFKQLYKRKKKEK